MSDGDWLKHQILSIHKSQDSSTTVAPTTVSTQQSSQPTIGNGDVGVGGGSAGSSARSSIVDDTSGPVPGASFNYNPEHWVAFSSPPHIVSSFPTGSRLFIGNLASERVERGTLAKMFAQYGNIAEILLKGSFGFIQYDCPEACQRAIQNEQGKMLAGLTLDLKVSKVKSATPSNRGSFAGVSGAVSYGGNSGVGNNFSGGVGVGRGGIVGSGGGGRESSMNKRQRSPEPDYGNQPRRSFTSHHGSRNGDLPRGKISQLALGSGYFPLQLRFGRNVPDVQIVVIGDIHRDFVNFVETSIHGRLHANTLIITRGISVADVEQQAQTEGVKAVVLLEPRHARHHCVTLHVLKGGGKIIEFDGIEPHGVVDVVQNEIRLAETQLSQSQQQYNSNAAINNNGNNVSAVNNNLSSVAALLASAQQQQQQQQTQQQPQQIQNLAALSALLSGVTNSASTITSPTTTSSNAALLSLASLLQQQQQQQPQQQQPKTSQNKF